MLDAGCGPGELTAELAARVPDGRVYAVDGSPRMAQLARERLGERATVWVSDLLELEAPEPVDLVFSAATFHWIADHGRLFERLRAALKPGGRLVAQCGGAGNVAAIRAAIEDVSGDPWTAMELRHARGDRGTPARGGVPGGPRLALQRPRDAGRAARAS